MLWLQHTLLADPAQGAGLRKNGGLHDTQGVLKTQAQRYAYGVQRVVGDILNLTCLLPYGIKNQRPDAGIACCTKLVPRCLMGSQPRQE